jgi:hypothetical protein
MPAATLFLCCLTAARAASPFEFDPVQELRQVLQIPVFDSTPSSADLLMRQRNLKQCVGALCRPPEQRDALLLRAWRDEDSDERIAAVDSSVRLELAHRFEQNLREILQRGDTHSRLAAALLLTEVAASIRTTPIGAWTLRDLGPQLADLVRGHDPALQEAASQALALIAPDAAVAVPALGTLFEARDPVLRRAAARGLATLVSSVSDTLRRTHGAALEKSRLELLQTTRAVIAMACGGLSDPDVDVRRLSVEALEQTALAVERLIGDSHLLATQPSDEVECYRREVEREGIELEPLAHDFKDLTPGLTGALHDADPTARFLAYRTLGHVGIAWHRLQERACQAALSGLASTNMPSVPKEVGSEESSPPIAQSGQQPTADGPLLERLRAALPELAAGLGDSDARVRRSAIETLETLGAEAAPAAAAVVHSLNDTDVFVRWAAARTLGRMGAVQAEVAVTVLCQRLNDADLDVRLAAADALRWYGPAAQAASPYLIRIIETGDAEMRLAAMLALEGIGISAPDAVQALTVALKAPEARVRKGAAGLLSKFGPAAITTREALRAALSDLDADVRKAASDALLNISPPPASKEALTQHMSAPEPAPLILAGNSEPVTEVPAPSPPVLLLAPIPGKPRTLFAEMR